MNKWFIFISAILFVVDLQAHDGHQHSQSLLEIGKLHFVFVHFPIALITMTVIAEVLFWWTKKSIYNQAAYFMICAAAFWVIPTIIFGSILGYTSHYEGELADLYQWHRLFGVLTATLTLLTAALKTGYLKEPNLVPRLYYGCLVVLFIVMNITGYIGGKMAFG